MKAAFTVHQSRAPPAGLLGRAMLSLLLSTLRRLLRCTHAGGAHERRRRAAAAALR
jgi:hypothetical protein